MADTRYFVPVPLPVEDDEPLGALDIPDDDPDELPDDPDELPDVPDEFVDPVDPLVDPLVLPLPLDDPDIEPVPERRAFSRSMQASRSSAATFWQTTAGSLLRLLDMPPALVEPDVPALLPVLLPDMPPDVAPLLPVFVLEVLPVCAIAAVAALSATASVRAFSCIIVMLVSSLDDSCASEARSQRPHARSTMRSVSIGRYQSRRASDVVLGDDVVTTEDVVRNFYMQGAMLGRRIAERGIRPPLSNEQGPAKKTLQRCSSKRRSRRCREPDGQCHEKTALTESRDTSMGVEVPTGRTHPQLTAKQRARAAYVASQGLLAARQRLR